MLTRRRRAALVAAAAAAAWLMIPSAARAETWGEVNPDDDSVDIGVGTDGSPGGSSGGSGDDSSGSGSGSDTSAEGGTSAPEGVCPNWAYEVVDSDSGTYMGASAGERPSEEHQLLGRSCRDPHTGRTMTGAQWVLPGEDAPIVDPAVLAQQAVDSLQLPTPTITASPEDKQLVMLPVWLAVSEASWETQSATASVPGLSVTATAEPVVAMWDMGDGTVVTCYGRGTPWTKDQDEEAESPDCGHVYEQPSEGELPVSVAITWEVSWSGGGESDTFPDMTTEANEAWPVTESHALNTE
ncbi:hypothetical protein [Glycomyces sp. MUSA5-2]|uniref:hypothetical protein n=1 Tax=Glycomyces sp. MUSA5-2 TaxID=2053002 RepID=UPI0030086A2D